MTVDQKFNIEAVDGKIIIPPLAQAKEYCLQDLLKSCPPDSLALDDKDRDWSHTQPVAKEMEHEATYPKAWRYCLDRL